MGLVKKIDFSDGWKAAINHHDPVKKTLSAWKVFDCDCENEPASAMTFQKILIHPDGSTEIQNGCCTGIIKAPSDVMKFLMLGFAELV